MYRPWTLRRCGVEIEIARETNDGATSTRSLRSVVEVGLRAVPGNQETCRSHEAWARSGNTQWETKTDSSCGFEITTPPFRLNEQGHYPQLREVCRELESYGARVNTSCGLHVHVEFNDADWVGLQRLVWLWVRYEPFFYECIPANRSSNAYCRPLRAGRQAWSNRLRGHAEYLVTSRTQSQFEQFGREVARYSGLNILPWWQHGRVEFRLHSGTINYDKIRAWAMLMASVVQRAVEPIHTRLPEITRPLQFVDESLSTSYVLKQLGLLPSSALREVPPESRELAAWVNARRQAFQRNAGRESTRRQIDQERRRTELCAAGGQNCTHQQEVGVLCRTHYEDYAANRLYRTAEAHTRRHGTRRRTDAGRYYLGNCSASGMNCERPLAPSMMLCAEHLADYRANLDYRILDTQPALPTLSDSYPELAVPPEVILDRLGLVVHDRRIQGSQRTSDAALMETGRCVARGANCPAPRSPGRYFCQTHYEDYRNYDDYRWITRRGEQPPESEDLGFLVTDMRGPSAPVIDRSNLSTCAAQGMNCPVPRDTRRLLCRYHTQDWDRGLPFRLIVRTSQPTAQPVYPMFRISENRTLPPEVDWEINALTGADDPCAARGMNCPAPRVHGRTLCLTHVQDLDSGRRYRVVERVEVPVPVPAVNPTYRVTSARAITSPTLDEDLTNQRGPGAPCAAAHMDCPAPREQGWVLCATHREDRVRYQHYRIIERVTP